MTTVPPIATRRTLMVLTTALTVLVLGCSLDRVAAPNRPEAATASGSSRVLVPGPGPEHALVGAGRPRRVGRRRTRSRSLPGGDQTNPDWSPDGTADRGRCRRRSARRLWIADADGTGARKLLDCGDAAAGSTTRPGRPTDRASSTAVRSPRHAPGWGSLEAVDVDDRRRVGHPAHRESVPSPRARAGRRTARRSSSRACTRSDAGLDADVDGVTLRIVQGRVRRRRAGPLTEPDLFAATADWSPDGKSIVYSALAGPDSEATGPVRHAFRGRRRAAAVDDAGRRRRVRRRADLARRQHPHRLQRQAARLVRAGVLLTVSADGVAEPESSWATSTIIGRHPRVEPGA